MGFGYYLYLNQRRIYIPDNYNGFVRQKNYRLEFERRNEYG